MESNHDVAGLHTDYEEEKCIFCSKRFSKNKPAVLNPDVSKLERLYKSCRIRNDNVGQYILANAGRFEDGSIPFRFHRNCKASYQSKYHQSFSQEKTKEGGATGVSKSVPVTRSSVDTFDWKTKCFICGEKCDPIRDLTNKRISRSWSLVETTVDSEQANLYTKVLEAAERLGDIEILRRLRSVPNGDLVAVEARYHRKKGCVTKYYSRKADFADANSTISEINTRIALELKSEFEHSIIEEKKVFLLSTLKRRFHELKCIEDGSNEETYRSFLLKKLLNKVWPELSFVHQHGKPDLVCSSDLSVGEALRAAKRIEESVKQLEDENTLNDSISGEETDESIVHRAVGVIRNRLIERTVKHEHEYFSSDEMSLEHQKAFTDPLLYKAIVWLANKKSFENADAMADERVNAKCLSIACDITTLVTSIDSPKHLGLAVHLHNDFGSRHLLEDLWALGHCVSYPELRRFLSSAAEYVTTSSKATLSGGLVPSTIVPRSEGGKLIVGVADNWDHNERTVDGKRTTHAMTSILVSPKGKCDAAEPRIPRTVNKTFDSNLVPGGSVCRVIPYKKPAERPCPTFDPPVMLMDIKTAESNVTKTAKLKELMYKFGRCSVFCEDLSVENKIIQPWSIFQKVTQSDPMDVSNVAYNPIIMANPSDYSTIYTVLLRLKECMKALGQPHAPIVFDMGLLSKALEIVWCKGAELEGIIPCEGGMHLLMAVFAGIGKLYGDAGLRQLLTDSGVYAPATVGNILAGKDFDRALTAFQMIDEALHVRFLTQFESWCLETDKDIHPDVIRLLKALRESDCTDSEGIPDILDQWNETASLHLIPLLEAFREEGREKSPTFQVWDDYLTRVSIPLKLFIQSTRSPNWQLHQEAKLSLLPLLFASNRTTYSKYMTIQTLQMMRLPEDVKQGFMEGLFTAKLSQGSCNNVWLDYALETTENKDLKGSGGIIGLTLKDNALARWFLARPVTSKYSTSFHKGIHSSKENNSSNGSSFRTKNYDNNVEKLVSIFESTFIDPFDISKAPAKLINFATGLKATDEIEKSMTSCLDKGVEMLESFIENRLLVNEEIATSGKNFFSPLSRCCIKTMSEVKKKQTVKRGKETLSGEIMFQRLLAVNAWKKVPLDRVFLFENTLVPMSMFAEDGSMLKSKKSDFMGKLEGLIDTKIAEIERADTAIFDGMAVIQSLSKQSDTVTFRDMARLFTNYICAKARSIPGISSVFIVFDKYNEGSIKSQTRKGRGNVSLQLHIHAGLSLPKDWKTFLFLGRNKENLAEYFTGYMIENAADFLKKDECLYVSCGIGEKCMKVSRDSHKEIPELLSDQEEADTRMILMAKYATEQGSDTIVVFSPDTDVLVLLVHHRQNIGTRLIYMCTGRSGIHIDTRRYIPVHTLFNSLSAIQHNILLSVYCFTGCDSTSSFYGKGKKRVFKLMMEHGDKYQQLKDLGESQALTSTQKKSCIAFISDLYGGSKCASLNELRCEKAMASVPPRSLPPTEDSLHLHCLRCVLQLWIWRHACIPKHDLPHIDSFGFSLDDTEGAKPVMMSQPIAAPELLNDVVCSCDICGETCTCFKNSQPCTHACSCENLGLDSMCTNVFSLTATFECESDSEASDVECA